MEKRFYNIAGTGLELECCDAWIAEEFCKFESTGQMGDEEKTIQISCLVGKPDFPASEMVLCSENMSVDENKNAYILRYALPNTVFACELAKEEFRAVIYLHTENANAADIKFSIRDAFFFYLQKLGRIVVHSASIVYRDRVWLFSAPAGTGKSTHAAMWHKKDYPITDFNGDLTLCYFDRDGKPVAASTPWCGTSGIYCNRVLALGGVIFLRRGNANQIKQLGVFEGALRMAARCISPVWVAQQAALNLHVAEHLAREVMLAELSCRPETEAAETAKMYIDNVINESYTVARGLFFEKEMRE